MRRSTKRGLALLGGAAVATLMWPGPSSADTSLGGYSGVAQAQAIRIQIYEPTIPIPASPQIDGSIGYAKSSTDTGPVTRATASYLWPGDVVGDGFGQLAGNDSAQYPVQVNSRYPATRSAPAHNTAQLTEGNGMTTSTDGFHTRATVTGLGIAGPNTDLLSGVGDGLHNLTTKGMVSAPPQPNSPKSPVPVGPLLASVATVQNMTSSTDIVVAAKTVTSTAETAMSEIKLLDGLVTIHGMKVTSTTVSDGTRATTTGAVDAGSIKVAGLDLGVGGQGLTLGGQATKLPQVPASVTKALAQIGIGVQFAPSTRTVDGATGELDSTGLQLTIDTVPLKTALGLGGVLGSLQNVVQQIPKIGSQLAPLLGLGPKIVLRIADVSSSATAAPAYTGSLTGGGTGYTGGGHQAGGVGSAGTPAGTGGGSPLGSGGALPASSNPAPGTGGPVVSSGQPAALDLPALGAIPRLVILGSIVAAAVCGWAFRALAGFVLGGARSCAYGLSTGVPDLRKG